MAALGDAVVTLLTADSTLMASLPGGIWRRPLLSGNSPLATPGAFVGAGVSAQVRPCLYIEVGGVGGSLDAQVVPAPLGYRLLTIWVYEPATTAGRVVIPTVKQRLQVLLNGASVATDDDGIAVMHFVGDLGDGFDQDIRAEVDQMRYRAATGLGRRGL